MTTITCKIPETLDAELARAARRRRVSKSAIVREALEARLKGRKAGGQTTAFDLARRFCGKLRGPADLSTHPRHLEGLGS